MRNKHYFLWLWLTLVGLVLPTTAMAVDYFEESYNSMCFIATPNGPGCVHFKIMYLDQTTGANGYIEKTNALPNGGWLYMKVDGSSDKRYIVAMYSKNDRSDDDDKDILLYTRFSARGENASKYADNGILVLTNHTTGNLKDVSTSNESYWVKKPTGDARCFVEFDWYYPVELAGQKVHFYMKASVASGEDLNDRELSGSPMNLTAKPDLYMSDPIFIPSGADQGYNRMVVSNTMGAELKIKSIAEIDSETGSMNKNITSECKTSKDGLSLLIPAINHERSVRVEALVPYSERVYYDLEPKVVKLAAFHNPKEFDLKADWADNGGTRLTWSVPYAEQEDVLSTDLVMVERQLYSSTNGSSDVWQNLEHLVLEKGKTNYDYTDNLTGCYGTEKYNSVRYRIYRAAVGTGDNYVSQAEMKDKASQVTPGSLIITSTRAVGGEVTMEVRVRNSNTTKTPQMYLPEKWKTR